jgi:peptidoglycan pentaglycine glycine transferase (the first glycine)
MKNSLGEHDPEWLRQSKAWDEFLESKTNTGFMQSSWWADFMAVIHGWGHFGTVLRAGETIVGGAVVWTYSFTPETCFYYIPEGPVLLESDSIAEQEQVFQKIMEFIEGKRKREQQVVSHLRIDPRWEHLPSFVRGFEEIYGYFHVPRDTRCIDLNPSESAILAQMKPKGRYNVGVACRHGVSVVEDTSPRGIEDFLHIYEETFARKDLEGLDPSYYHTLIPTLSALDRGSVFFAEYQGMRLATALVVYFGCTATYLYGASLATHRNMMAPYLLQFEIMCKAKARGCQWYDFFGIAPESEPNHLWTNVSVFKRKLGGQELHLVPTLDYIYDPVAYQEWKAIEDKDA